MGALQAGGWSRRQTPNNSYSATPAIAGKEYGSRLLVGTGIIIDGAQVPVIVDAGVGTASDAAIGMELGCDGVLMNTAIAAARDPVLMARAMRKAVEAGREAYLAGRMPRKTYAASPSSPGTGMIA
jgi:thiazole synthase ThiGH ThiG subunit